MGQWPSVLVGVTPSSTVDILTSVVRIMLWPLLFCNVVSSGYLLSKAFAELVNCEGALEYSGRDSHALALQDTIIINFVIMLLQYTHTPHTLSHMYTHAPHCTHTHHTVHTHTHTHHTVHTHTHTHHTVHTHTHTHVCTDYLSQESLLSLPPGWDMAYTPQGLRYYQE